ncbi:MAG: hypothetical protein ABJL67_20330 [Sulfitobacter sp.]
MVDKNEFQHRSLVFKAMRIPKITRVCQKIKSGSKRIAKGGDRLPCFGQLVGQKEFLFLHLIKARFVGCDQRLALGVDKAIHKLSGLAIQLFELVLDGVAILFCGCLL